MKLLVMQFSTPSLLFGPNILLSNLFSNTLSKWPIVPAPNNDK
jgi:hypothetical protein